MINFKKKMLATTKLGYQSGFVLLGAILVLAVVSVMIAVIFSLVLLSVTKSERNSRQISVLDVAEAGINYYLWHLAHNPSDYKDGNTTPATAPYGPYTHNLTDSSGEVIGTYTLYITPPPAGSNRVTVESRGTIVGGNENRTIVAELGIPSFANYSIVADDTVNHLRIGQGTHTYGPVHNNGGVRFDGVAHAIVTSASINYDDPDHTGANEDGVHTHEPNPNNVFLAGRQFPVPPVNFSAVSTDLQGLRTLGQVSGQGIYYANSGSLGYHIVLLTNDTFNIYRVTGQGGNCNSVPRENITSEVSLGNRNFPSNGVIFIEDKLWIDGKINSAQLTIAAARIGATSAQEKSVIINNDLEYTNYDGTDKVGIVAQHDVTVGYNSEGAFSGSSDTQELRIDAAMIAQTGRIGRNYYNSSCGGNYVRNNITVYGSLATHNRYGFAYTDGTGYTNRNLLYDPYLTLVPPPHFPTTGSYSILSWKEK